MMSLEELYLSENFIKQIDGVSSLTNLIILDYSYNQISKLNGIENLQKLEEFWVLFFKITLNLYYYKVNKNKIENFDDLEILKINPTIKTIYLSMNPVADFPSYREKLMSLLPNLEQIDHFPLKMEYNIKTKNK